MAQRPYRPSDLLVLARTASLLVFAFDPKVVAPHAWAYYLLAFAAVAVWGRRREVYAISVLLSLMMVGMLLLEPAPAAGPYRQFPPAAAVWALAWVAEQRLEAQEHLEQQVLARTAELRASEERYRLLSENATDVVWAADLQGNPTYSNGRLVGLRGTSRDVTRRHLAEAALQHSEDRLAKIFRSSLGAIAITRIADGVFVDANPAYEDMIGYTREQLLGHTAAELGILPANTRAILAAAAHAHTYLRGAETQCVTAGGIGIAPDQITRVRRPFTQLDGSLARRHEGIGLGLAYVDEMVRLLGGRLDIESTVGQGSCFTIILPA